MVKKITEPTKSISSFNSRQAEGVLHSTAWGQSSAIQRRRVENKKFLAESRASGGLGSTEGAWSVFSHSGFGLESWAVGLVGGGQVPGSASHLLLHCTSCDVVGCDAAIAPLPPSPVGPSPSTLLEGSRSRGWFSSALWV